MSDKNKLVSRIKRIQGQLSSVSMSIECDEEVGSVLQTVAASRGALAGLIAEIIEHHVRSDVIPKDGHWNDQHEAAAARLVQIVTTYLK